MKRCKQCKAPLDVRAKVCPNCGAPVPRRHVLRTVLIVLAVLCVVAGGTIGALVLTGNSELITGLPGRIVALFTGGDSGKGGGQGGATPGPAPEDQGDFLMLDGSFTDEPILNEEDARAALAGVASAMGMDPETELGDCTAQMALDTSFYRFEQVHDGVPVYGRSVVVSADDAGTALNLTSNYRSLDDVDTATEVTAEQAERVASNAASEDDAVGEAEFVLNQGLVIYSLGDVEPQTTWQVLVVGDDAADYYFISAQTGEVVARERAAADATGKNLDGETVEFATERYEAGYAMIDRGRNMRVYNAPGADRGEIVGGMQLIGENGTVANAVQLDGSDGYDWSADGKTVLTIEQGGTSLIGAVMVHPDGAREEIVQVSYDYRDHLARSSDDTNWDRGPATVADSVANVYDYYNDVLGWKSYDNKGGQLQVVYGLNENNAFSFGMAKGDFQLIAAGQSMPYPGRKVIGHEFTHAVVGATCDLSGENDSEAPALNEGVSDLIGIAATDYGDDGLANNSAGWEIEGANRDLEKPNRLDGPAIYEGTDYWPDNTDPSTTDSEKPKVDVHHNATVIGHAGYLMCADDEAGVSGDPLTTEEMAQTVFLSFMSMPTDCTFVQFRLIMENAAETLYSKGVLTKAQVERVTSAFDAVDIERSDEGFTLREGAKLTVLDVNEEPYGNYTMTFRDVLHKDAEPIVVEVTTTDSVEVPKGVGEGVWGITLVDGADSSRTCYEGVIVASDGAQEGTIRTDFGQMQEESKQGKAAKNITGTRDVALTLDVSSSMLGDPIDQLKSAAKGFVDTALTDQTGVEVGLITYSDDAGVSVPLSSSAAALTGEIDSLEASGSTDIEDALRTAKDQLNEGTASRRIIVLMSDGEPTDGLTGDDLIKLATDIKDEGVRIYTVGFNEGTEGQALLTAIASENCHYQITELEDLDDFFTDIADEINGVRFIYSRIACPVDVTVRYNGETLSSAGDAPQTRTSFGSLAFEDAVDEDGNPIPGGEGTVKVLRLREGVPYDIEIEGTDSGTMDYTIGFMDEAGDYTDIRTFEDIDITRRTRISTVAEPAAETLLSVDEDGDGVVDFAYRAGANEEAQLVDNGWAAYLVIAGVSVLFVLGVAWRVRRLLRAAARRERAA